MLLSPMAADLSGTALAWFILFLIGLAVVLWFLSWLLFPVGKPIPIGESLRELNGMTESMAGRLATFGIRNDYDLVRLTPRGQQELESQLGLHQGEYDRWKQQILDRWRNQYLPASFREIADITPDPELGGVYVGRPQEVDDLTKIPGIDKLTANRMNHAGIYTYEQLRLMAAEQQACFKQRFNLTAFDFETVPDYGVTAQWLAFLREGKSNSVRSLESEPQLQDQSKLAEQGTDAAIVATSFNCSSAIRTAAADTVPIDSLEDAHSTTTVTATRDTEIPTSRIDAELGRVYNCAPPHRDDLTELSGIDAEAAEKLYRAGIFTTDQIMSLTPVAAG